MGPFTLLRPTENPKPPLTFLSNPFEPGAPALNRDLFWLCRHSRHFQRYLLGAEVKRHRGWDCGGPGQCVVRLCFAISRIPWQTASIGKILNSSVRPKVVKEPEISHGLDPTGTRLREPSLRCHSQSAHRRADQSRPRCNSSCSQSRTTRVCSFGSCLFVHYRYLHIYL